MKSSSSLVSQAHLSINTLLLMCFSFWVIYYNPQCDFSLNALETENIDFLKLLSKKSLNFLVKKLPNSVYVGKFHIKDCACVCVILPYTLSLTYTHRKWINIHLNGVGNVMKYSFYGPNICWGLWFTFQHRLSESHCNYHRADPRMLRE